MVTMSKACLLPAVHMDYHRVGHAQSTELQEVLDKLHLLYVMALACSVASSQQNLLNQASMNSIPSGRCIQPFVTCCYSLRAYAD